MSLQAAQPSKKLLQVLNAKLRSAAPYEFTGTLAAASAVVTAVPDTTNITVGDKIYLTVVDATAPLTVLSKTATTITLSAVAGTTQAGAKLVAISAVSGEIDAYKVGLFTGNPSITVDTVLGDLTQPTYTGYALIAASLLALRENTNGDQINPLASVTFQPSDATGLPQTATGIILVGTIGGTDYLLLSEPFDDAFVMTSALDGRSVQLDLYIRNQPVYGGICSTC